MKTILLFALLSPLCSPAPHDVSTGDQVDTAIHQHDVHEDRPEVESKERLRLLFETIDVNKDGIMDAKELIGICLANNIDIEEAEADRAVTLPDNTVGLTSDMFVELLAHCPSSKIEDILFFLLHGDLQNRRGRLIGVNFQQWKTNVLNTFFPGTGRALDPDRFLPGKDRALDPNRFLPGKDRALDPDRFLPGKDRALDAVCASDAVNLYACFCKNNERVEEVGEVCSAGEGCNYDGTCLPVCAADAVNYDACFCKNSQGGGKACAAGQGCNSAGTCLDVCTVEVATSDDCFCKMPINSGVVCMATQTCTKDGTCRDKNEKSEIQKIKDEMMNMKDKMMKMNKIIDTLQLRSVLRSCAEYSRYGLEESGEYMIDPDGKGQGQEPFQVFCNFTSGATEVMHSGEKNGPIQIIDDQCDGPGCYRKDISYINGLTAEPVSMNQISSLIDLAQHCEQEIRFDCKLSPLNSGAGTWWKGRHGEAQNYLTGEHSGCDCHPEYPSSQYPTCNNRTGWFYGKITDTSALPIMKMYFGGFGNEKGVAFHYSRLKCYGEKDVETAISCSSLKKKGVMTSGYYNIKPAGTKYARLVFCDMKSDTYTNVPQVEEVSDSSPLGTIMAWVPRPEASLTPEVIPDGWLPCDGTTITKGPWAGGKTPELNSVGAFLRGSSEGNTLEMEEDQVQDHQHDDEGHSHSCTATSSAGEHRHGYWNAIHGEDDGPFCGSEYTCTDDDKLDHIKSRTDPASIKVTTSCSTGSESSGIGGVTSSYRSGTETRPRNMKVNYVMRCW